MSDYSDIQAELDDFENAVYGEEVRGSMISAIKKIHDVAERAAGAPDASSASEGQVLTADGNGGHYWGDIEAGDSVPTNVRQAIFNLLDNNAFANDDTYTADLAVIQSWATEITSISVSPTTLNINGMSQETIVATTQPAGGIVSWSSSDESIATVSGGVVTPTGVNGACTITASCGGKSATCAVTVSGFATLLSISAVYTQSDAVHDTDTLDSLKSDLVVTANWSDGRSTTVTDYTLQGELVVGTRTITVAYSGKTTTFNVTVTYRYVFDTEDETASLVIGSTSFSDAMSSAQSLGITGRIVNDRYQPSNNNRRSIYALNGDLCALIRSDNYVFDDNTDIYPFFIPPDATQVTIAMTTTDSTPYMGIAEYTLSNGKYTKANESGWQAGPTYTCALHEGNQWITCAFKRNSSGSNYSGSEISRVVVTFS